MINFEEELKNFKPSLEVEEAEQAIYNHELVDMTDMMQEMIREFKQNMQDWMRKALKWNVITVVPSSKEG